MGVAVVVSCSGLAQAYPALHTAAISDADIARFPQRLGNYSLARSWNETQLAGQVVYVWAQYVPVDGGMPIAVGVAPGLGWHDPIICHAIRGENPLWQGPLKVSTADNTSISFSSAFYSDGVTQDLEASTQCAGNSCGEYATERTHFGFIFSRPDPKDLLSQNPQHPVPVLLRAETPDVTLPADAAREELTRNLRLFLASVRVQDLTQPYNR
jgi:exosortase J